MEEIIKQLDYLKTAVNIYETERNKKFWLMDFEVEIGSIIEHETGEIGIVCDVLGHRLMVRYINYHHYGYELESKFKVLPNDYFKTK